MKTHTFKTHRPSKKEVDRIKREYAKKGFDYGGHCVNAREGTYTLEFYEPVEYGKNGKTHKMK